LGDDSFAYPCCNRSLTKPLQIVFLEDVDRSLEIKDSGRTDTDYKDWLMRRLLVLPTLALILLGLIALPVKAQSSNEAALRRFVERLLGLPNDKAQLLIEELPKDLSVAVPIPEKARILGSIVRGRGNYQIVFDAVQSPEQVEAFYRDRLKVEGWVPQAETFRIGGFDSSTSSIPDIYCQSPTGPALFLTIGSAENSFTPVSLTLSANQVEQICRARSSEWDLQASPLPRLGNPKDTEVAAKGGGGGGDQFYSLAGITTKLSSQALFADYAAQLKKSGWIQQANGQERGLNWSIWRFQDQQKQSWQAFMTFTQVEGRPGEYIARIIAFQDNASE
jgi:hypothetical protein